MKYYCLGIKGAGMSTLANILYDLGNDVIGYDDVPEYKFTEEGLDKRNIKIFYDGNHEIDKDTIVTYSVALPSDHKEILRVKELGNKIEKYNEILGKISRDFKTIAVSGTHGKTTTSSMIMQIFNNVMDVNYFIGDGSGYASRDNEYFVLEADEFNRHFLAYQPYYTIITNIELEHTEIYRDIEDIKETFLKFSNNTTKKIIACGDNENIRDIDFLKEVVYYGFFDNNDYIIKNLLLNSNGSSFDLYYKDNLYHHFNLKVYGKHMVLNAVAAIIVAIGENIPIEAIEKGLNNFKNTKRRFSEKEVNGTIIIDDYAHHPTEIKATIEAVRQKYPNKELVAIFKPNTYSRTEKFYKDFANVLNLADYVYMTEIESNREKQSEYPGITSKTITDLLEKYEMIDDDSTDKLLKHDNAIICFMSCASVSHLIKNYEDKLK